MLNAEQSEVVETTMVAYDAIFSELGPEARTAFRDTVEEQLTSGLDIPEVHAVSQATYYSNWNFGLVNGLRAKIAGEDLAEDDEDNNQAANIAEFVAKDLKIAAKIAAAIEQQYSDVTKTVNNTQHINTLTGQLIDDIDKLEADIGILQSDVARYNDPQSPDYDTALAQKAQKDLNTKTTLLDAANELKTTLSGFSSEDDVATHTQEFSDYLQLRIDALEIARVEKLEEYKQYRAETFAGSADLAETAKFEAETLATESLTLIKQQDVADSFVEQDNTVRTSSIKAGVNILSVAQVSASFATNPNNTAEGYAGSAGFLGEAVGSALGDLLDVAGHAKFAKGFKGAASIALVGGASAGFVSSAKLLADPDLPPEMRAAVQAEVGLQGTALAFGVVENALGIAELAVKAGTKAANVIGKAAPVVGAIASVVGAINPAKWAEFDQKQDRIDALAEADTYSSGLLSDLLQETKDTEAAFYGVTTGLDAVTGVASGALAASGVGAPIAAAVGLIGGAISAIVGAFEQVALEDIADKYAEKIRTDENGNPQTVEEFFAGSFAEKQEKTKSHYVDFFNDIVADEDIDQVIALGGQRLHADDLELAARSKTSGELNKTAQNFVDTFTDDGWQIGDNFLTPTPGEDVNVIQLPDANGAKSYLTFTTPLFLAGTESTSRAKTGKNNYETTLKITDLSGWDIRDFGNNETTFDMGKVVSSAEDRFGNTMEVGISIGGGGGDDTLFAYESEVTFDGGTGTDTASYARLSGTELEGGIFFGASSDTSLIVSKRLAEGSKYYQEGIDSFTTSHGKRTEVVEFREVSLSERDGTHHVIDTLRNVEILHGSRLGDQFEVSTSAQVEQVFGFGGDDYISVGESIEIVGGGAGDDTIKLSHALLEDYFNGDRTELYVDAGDGQNDTLEITAESLDRLVDELDTEQIRAQTAEDIAESLIPIGSANRAEEVAATTASLTNILRNSDDTALQQLTILNTEKVHINLDDGGTPDQTVAHSLSTIREAVNNGIINLNTDNTTTELDISVDAALSSNAVAVLGSDHQDTIQGSGFDDYLFGGDGNDTFDIAGSRDVGNDILVGGAGRDEFNYTYENADFASGHHVITGPVAADIQGDVFNFYTDLRLEVKIDYYRFGDDLVVSFDADSSVTIADFYTGDLAGTHIGVRYGADANGIYYNSNFGLFGASPEEANTDPNNTFYFNYVFTGDRSLDHYSEHGNYYYYSANHIQGDVGTIFDLDGTADADAAAYAAEFENNYLNFRASSDVWATHQDQDLNTNFANELGEILDSNTGGAAVSDAELDDLLEIASITEKARGNTSGSTYIAGSSGDDSLSGSNNADTIDGFAGDDIINGGFGIDILDGGDGFDLVSYTGPHFPVKVDLRGSQSTHYKDGGVWMSGDGIGHFEGAIGTTSSDELIGNGDANYLQGGLGADTISGNGGNDVIHGGSGLDTLDGGAGFDIASYKGASWAIWFQLDSSDPNFVQQEQYLSGSQWLQGDTVENFEGVIGTSHGDILTGNSGANYFDGGAGNDRIEGLDGNDIILGGDGTDTLDGGEGVDLLSYEDHAQAVRINLQNQTSEFIPAPGSYVSGDSISGFENVTGTDKNDDLIGNDAGNQLEGGGGFDRLEGGAGFDTFVFDVGHGSDRITDFSIGEDLLLFEFGDSIADFDIEIVESANGLETFTRIVTGEGTIDLSGIEVDTLTANSFVFV